MHKNMKHASCLVLSVGLLLLTTQVRAEQDTPVLHSFTLYQDSIVFELTSHGCSKDADFALRTDDGPGITLIRNRPDRCKRAPMVFQVKRSLTGSGLSLQTPFAVRNPFAPPPAKHSSKGKPFTKNTRD